MILFLDAPSAGALQSGTAFLRIAAPFYFAASFKIMCDAFLCGKPFPPCQRGKYLVYSTWAAKTTGSERNNDCNHLYGRQKRHTLQPPPPESGPPSAGGPSAGDRQQLWMSGYTARQFSPQPENVRITEDLAAVPEGYCFVETQDPGTWATPPAGLIVYRWNRIYPADLFCTLPLEQWTLVRREEFAGSSHEKITKEVYTR